MCATVLDSEEEEIHSDSEKENQESKRNVYKREKKSVPKKSLEDYISDGSGKNFLVFFYLVSTTIFMKKYFLFLIFYNNVYRYFRHIMRLRTN